MADILIKGMEMPTFCLCCPCIDVDYGECIPKEHRHIETEEYLSNRRPDWCPLVEVEETKRIGVNGEWETIYQEARS